MDDANKQTIDKLQGVIRQIEAVISELGGSMDGVRPDKIDALDAALNSRTCLQCKEKQERKASYVRGLCKSCYQTTQHRLRKSQVTEREMVFAALLAPKSYSPIRPPAEPTLLDEYLSGRDRKPEVGSSEDARLLAESIKADKASASHKKQRPAKQNETK